MSSLVVNKKINGRKYTLKKMTAVKGRKVLLRLMQIAAPLLGGASSEDELELGNVDIKDLLVETLNGIKEEDLEWVISSLFQNASVLIGENLLDLSEEDSQNAAWSGNYGEMIEALTWALMENFGGFFAGLRKKGGNQKIVYSETGIQKTEG